MHRVMEADDDFLAPEQCFRIAGEQQVVRAVHTEAVRQQDCEQILTKEVRNEAVNVGRQEGMREGMKELPFQSLLL